MTSHNLPSQQSAANNFIFLQNIEVIGLLLSKQVKQKTNGASSNIKLRELGVSHKCKKGKKFKESPEHGVDQNEQLVTLKITCLCKQGDEHQMHVPPLQGDHPDPQGADPDVKVAHPVYPVFPSHGVPPGRPFLDKTENTQQVVVCQPLDVVPKGYGGGQPEDRQEGDARYCHHTPVQDN